MSLTAIWQESPVLKNLVLTWASTSRLVSSCIRPQAIQSPQEIIDGVEFEDAKEKDVSGPLDH